MKSNNSAEEKFRVYNELTEYYRVSDQYPIAEKYVQEQLKLAKNEQNYTEAVKALVQKGIIELNQSQYEKVPKLIDAANSTAQKQMIKQLHCMPLI